MIFWCDQGVEKERKTDRDRERERERDREKERERERERERGRERETNGIKWVNTFRRFEKWLKITCTRFSLIQKQPQIFKKVFVKI